MSDDMWVPIQDFLKRLLEELPHKPEEPKAVEWKTTWGHS